MKRLFSMLIAVVMCFGVSSVAFATEIPNNDSIAITTAKENEGIVPFAAETWGKTSSFRKVGTFTMEGNNLTPVKTMGSSGTLSIKLDDAHVVGNLSSINLKVQIKDHSTQRVLKEWTITRFSGIANYELSGGLAVRSGQRIQVHFTAYDAATGNYNDNRQVNITYSYRLR